LGRRGMDFSTREGGRVKRVEICDEKIVIAKLIVQKERKENGNKNKIPIRI
jgi:hypothetical protein